MTTNQDHEDAASSEMAWFKCGPFDGDGPNGYDAWWTIEEAGEHGRMLAEVYDETIADRIIADHELAAWAVRAREWTATRRRGIHDPTCNRYEKGLRFSTDADCDCGLDAILAGYPGSAAAEGAGQ